MLLKEAHQMKRECLPEMIRKDIIRAVRVNSVKLVPYESTERLCEVVHVKDERDKP